MITPKPYIICNGPLTTVSYCRSCKIDQQREHRRNNWQVRQITKLKCVKLLEHIKLSLKVGRVDYTIGWINAQIEEIKG